MEDASTAAPLVRPIDLISGLGALQRAEICQIIALMECVDSIFLALGTADGVQAWLGLQKDAAKDGAAAKRIEARQKALAASPVSDAALRFRLWARLSDALALPDNVILSHMSAKRGASAFAVRAAERLTPAIRARHRKADQKEAIGGIGGWLDRRADAAWKGVKAAFSSEPALSFPEIVAEELLALLADKEFIDVALEFSDPEIAVELKKGHDGALRAMAAGGVWVGGAAVVANAGFLPYILAAQLSAFIPLVNGPFLVSLLATLINPVTVIAGVAALGWVGMGRGSRVVRSQVAARFGVLLAAQGVSAGDKGLDQFLADMRQLDKESAKAFKWMSTEDRTNLRRRVASLTGRLSGPLPAAVGAPPDPWASKKMATDVPDAVATLGLTAAEMLWHAAAIDPTVMRAADFSRAADLGDPMNFAQNAAEFANSASAWSLRGYTAERLVMDQLIADGHDVQLAEASNTPGLDLLVDGEPVQVKCGMALSNLTEHFEKYSDIPVIANAALAEQAAESGAPWAHLVTTLPGFEIATLEEQIAEALGHAADLADPDILQFAMSVGVLRGGMEVALGRVPLSDLPAWLILDGASRGLLVFAGGNVGAWFGLIAIGPAGALILGPAIGAAALLGNSRLKGFTEKQLMAEWHNSLQRAAVALHDALFGSLERRIVRLEKRAAGFFNTTIQSELDGWMARRAQDDLIAALEDLESLKSQYPEREVDALYLLLYARDVAPTDAVVLACIHDVEQTLLQKLGLKAVMMDAGNTAGDRVWEFAERRWSKRN